MNLPIFFAEVHGERRLRPPLRRRFNRVGLLLMMLFIGAATALAAPSSPEVDAKIRELALKFTEAREGEEAVAAMMDLRSDHVAVLFDRLMNRTVYLWKGQLVYCPELTKDAAGESVAPLFDLLDDKPLEVDGKPIVVPAREIESFQGHRRVRQAVKNAQSVIGLLVDDPAARLAAAKKVGDAREALALSQLRKMVNDDADAKIRQTARESELIIIAAGADPAGDAKAKLDAVKALGDMKSLRAMSMIEQMQTDNAKSEKPSKEDAAAFAAALDQIHAHQSFVSWVGTIFKGLSAGSILILMALGLGITFGLMGVINMAHGEMMMIGGVTTWAVEEFFKNNVSPEYFNWYFVAAFPLAFLAAALAGLLIEVLVVRHLYRRPLDSLLATIGLSLILIQAVRLWKGDNLGMSSPSWFTGGFEIMQDVTLPYNRLFIMLLTAVCVLAISAMMNFTRLGLMIRATVQNRQMAQSLGVNTKLVDACTFAFGAGLAGIAGYAFTLTSNVNPEMGQAYIVESFLVVVTGGVGKLIGVVCSGLGLGALLKFIEPLNLGFFAFDATWSKVLVLLLVVLFIQRRPSGLFPDKGRLADA
ncbi:MAG: urea ABC transporter permease subunit UrtB [Planctomycetes bacterium]|nr:urea ABC transporter permease subunit UrtB [Planctomycetota bacterium]